VPEAARAQRRREPVGEHLHVPRQPRLEQSGGIYHVFARGVRKEPLFNDDEDRVYLLNLLGVIVDRHGWLILAYCLMGNHYHLLLETPQPNLSAGMHRFNGAFAQWFNERHRLEGHVFGRRFQSVPAESDSHLLELVRYVVLNPVRAKLCSHPADWGWSSYRGTIGAGRPARFLARDRVLGLFRGPGRTAEEHYERFVTAEIGLVDDAHETRSRMAAIG